MHEATTIPALTSDTSENLTAAARRAESWFGEPFLAPDEDPTQALAPGTARRAALDDASAEIEAGLSSPSARWKVRYGLMLGLERVLTENPPHTAAGTELRRHQVDALAGMLAELIAATQRAAEENGNGNGSGNGAQAEAAELDDEADDDVDAGYIDEDDSEAELARTDPGAERR
jgi:ribonuclease E